MDFKETTPAGNAEFEAARDEIERAVVGFMSMGEFDKTVSLTATRFIDEDKARLVIAGNLALLRNLQIDVLGVIQGDRDDVEDLRSRAITTVISGLNALEIANR